MWSRSEDPVIRHWDVVITFSKVSPSVTVPCKTNAAGVFGLGWVDRLSSTDLVHEILPNWMGTKRWSIEIRSIVISTNQTQCFGSTEMDTSSLLTYLLFAEDFWDYFCRKPKMYSLSLPELDSTQSRSEPTLQNWGYTWESLLHQFFCGSIFTWQHNYMAFSCSWMWDK